MARNRKKVIVCGDLHNLGDLQLLLQNLAIDGEGALVRRWAPLPPAIEAQVSQAGGTLIDGRQVVRFARACFGAELVIGGGQLVRGNSSLKSLAGLVLASAAVRAGGGRVVTRGLGVSRIADRARRLAWSAILAPCRSVKVRDDSSAQNARALVPAERIVKTADMVFLRTRATERFEAGQEKRESLVIAPCADPSEDRAIASPALDALVRGALAERPAMPVEIACHDPRASMDAAAADALIARYPDLRVVKIASYELDTLVAVYRRAALVLTNRLHALIFALHTDTAVLVIDDGNSKLQDAARAFGVPSLPLDAHDPELIAERRQAAQSFDHAARRALLDRLAAESARNLD